MFMQMTKFVTEMLSQKGHYILLILVKQFCRLDNLDLKI